MIANCAGVACNQVGNVQRLFRVGLVVIDNQLDGVAIDAALGVALLDVDLAGRLIGDTVLRVVAGHRRHQRDAVGFCAVGACGVVRLAAVRGGLCIGVRGVACRVGFCCTCQKTAHHQQSESESDKFFHVANSLVFYFYARVRKIQFNVCLVC